MSDYKGVRYAHVIGDQWRVVWPSGLRGVLIAATEDELKAKIDASKIS